MKIRKRSMPYKINELSLTGDFLSYLNCPLQYRLTNRGRFPLSRPYQYWFGRFIHAVLDEAYKKWKQNPEKAINRMDWEEEIRPIELDVYRRLLNAGIRPPPSTLFCSYERPNNKKGLCPDSNHPHKLIASKRAEEAIHIIGELIFEHITHTEVKLKGLRRKTNQENTNEPRSYGITGIVDVISSVSIIDRPFDSLRHMIESVTKTKLDELEEDEFEIIIDYKGGSRPLTNENEWKYHEWQILEYAWLRQRQIGNKNKIRYGIIFYVNELAPSKEDLKKLVELLKDPNMQQFIDVKPGKRDMKLLNEWDLKEDISTKLTANYRGNRAFRLIEITQEGLNSALKEFDKINHKIEIAKQNEQQGVPITQAWEPNPSEKSCVVCNFVSFCPAKDKPGNVKEIPPPLIVK